MVEYNETADKGKYYEIYSAIAEAPVPREAFTSHMLVDVIRGLNRELDIPDDLSCVGVTEDKFEAMTDDAMKSGNIAVNPRVTTREDILELYRKAYRIA